SERWRIGQPILCIPGVSLLDEATAILVANLVERRGISTRWEEAGALSLSRILSLDTKNVALICLCFLGSATAAHVGYAVRRIRRKAPDAFIVVSLLGNAASIDGLDQYGNVEVALNSLQATVDKILAIATVLGEKSLT